MAVWSEVSLSEIELTRIDAEFYKPEYLIARKAAGERKLRSYGVIVLHPAEFLRRYSDVGHFVLLAQNNRDNYYDWTVKQRVASGLGKVIARNRLEFGDVTITRSGANFGQTSVIGAELQVEPIYACADLLILRSRLVDGHLISTYFNSSVGKLLVNRGAYGAAQPHIAPTYIKEIPLPEALLSCGPEIRSLIVHSRELASKSSDLFLQAQNLLDSALGLNELKFEKPISYATCFSEVEQSRRFDSEHYFPAFRALKAGLPNGVSLSPLSGYLEFCKRGQQPAYSETGLPVVNSKHVQPNRVVLARNRRGRPNADSNLQIRFGDMLLNGTGRGTIGRAAPYLDEGTAIADNHVTILRSASLDPAYLALYINSVAGQLQVEMHQRGSSGQLELYPLDIRKFLAWLAPDDFQKEIRRLHDLAAAAERESRLLLEQAKLRVEQLIEEAVKV